MHITKVKIENFKCFKDTFTLNLNRGANILVGNNEAGKTTILEAIHLGLTGMLNGRYLKNELSQYLFNREVEKSYIECIKSGKPEQPPYISIELFMDGTDVPELATLEGDYNSETQQRSGVKFCVEFDEQYKESYEELLKGGGIKTIPIEYYKISCKSFARIEITSRNIPIKSALIDSTSSRIQNGSDVYISRIIRENLEEKERVEISQAHRQMKEAFMETPSVISINLKINENASITEKKVTISVDLSTQNAWEMSLMTYLDEIPFHYVGKGEQSIVKTNLALSHKKSNEANVILLEEPENHLSHSKLNQLIKKIQSNQKTKQIIVSTHSSFVANKLGLDHLILLNDLKNVRLNQLSPDTQNFFSKLAGYDTLRLILCKKAILVEGDSDELVIQKAYMLANQGRLPLEDGVDVISVGTSFLRFLEIAEKINKPVSVVTDNDGDVIKVEAKYAKYLGYNAKNGIRICYDKIVDPGAVEGFNYNTLEPKFVKENGRDAVNTILGTSHMTDDELHKYMKSHKTECALKIFDATGSLKFPAYILEAITVV